MSGINLFIDIGILIIIATVGGYLAKLLKQPMMLFYMLIGVILGPEIGSRIGSLFNINFHGLIASPALVENVLLLGVAFLLFIVGLELNFKKLKNIGHIALIGTPIQVALMFLLGYVITTTALVKWFPGTKDAIYVGLILAFSSTVIVVKLLSDKHELNTLHGRIIIGILIMQDVLAIIAISILTTSGSPKILLTMGAAIGIIALAVILGKYVFPKIFEFAARSQELLLMSSLSVLFLFVLLFKLIHFSEAVGAFVAGMTLANLPYNYEVIGKMKGLKDFFAALFFLSVGMQFSLSGFNSAGILIPIIILFIMVIFVKPLIFMFLSAFFGYTERTLFQTSFSLGQISEFSLIIVAIIAIDASKSLLSIVIILMILTSIYTSYFIKFEDKIFALFKKRLSIFGRSTSEMEYIPAKYEFDVVLIGYDRIGFSIYKTLKQQSESVLVCDYNPDIIKKLISHKIPCIYGDIADNEIVNRLHLNKAKLVISTSPNHDDNLYLIRRTKQKNKKVHIFVTAETVEDAIEFYKHGADYVIIPHFLGGEKVSSIIEEAPKDLRKFRTFKKDHLAHLKERLDMGHGTRKNHHQ